MSDQLRRDENAVVGDDENFASTKARDRFLPTQIAAVLASARSKLSFTVLTSGEAIREGFIGSLRLRERLSLLQPTNCDEVSSGQTSERSEVGKPGHGDVS